MERLLYFSNESASSCTLIRWCTNVLRVPQCRSAPLPLSDRRHINIKESIWFTVLSFKTSVKYFTSKMHLLPARNRNNPLRQLHHHLFRKICKHAQQHQLLLILVNTDHSIGTSILLRSTSKLWRTLLPHPFIFNPSRWRRPTAGWRPAFVR